MIRYYKICKKYFKLNANNKRLLLALFFSAFLRSFTVLGFPIFTSKIVDFATQGLYKEAFINLLYLGINYLIYNLVYHWNYIAYRDNTNYVYTKLQENVVDKVATYDENFTKKLTKSYLVNTTSNDIWDVCMFADRMMDAITHFISLLIALGILLFNNIYIGIIVLVFNLLYLYLLSECQKKKDYYLMGQRKQQDKIVEMFAQTLDGTKEIKSFDMHSKLNEYLEINKKAWTKQYFLKRIYWDRSKVVLPILIMVAKVIAYIIVILGIAKGNMSVGMLVLVIGYIDRIENENTSFFERINKICNSSVRIDRLYNVMYYDNKNMLEFGKNITDDIFGNVSFDNVSFTYENNLILDNVSFDIESNSLTAIVGKSGSGKSTIFRLLLRLYKLDKGNIYIDGTSIYDYSKDVYSSNVSISTQKPFIFNMSIRENLSLVDSNKEKQIEACKRVGIHDFIMSLPNGYNTILKEDATDISGGQKQLIALARTLLSKSEILLFDEVTASLDPNTAKQVVKVLKDLKKDHTVIMITHKPQLMKIADEILVIDHGKLVGKGKHKELIENNKYYQILQK
ncbi:MAG: ABC transporter ATP-binding protein [Bacilli bacterium]|nr:ABC transporter ATP-binding protein [Bacilli bacterium]MBQ9853933.1 ABC transporter ATP-binding protein [Bacilli bacterium]